MADAGEIWYRAFNSFGNNLGQGLSDAMQDYHKRHVAYSQAEQTATMLSQLGVSEDGQITAIDPASKDKSIKPIIDPKALEMFRARNNRDWERATGGLEALSKIGAVTAHSWISQRAEAGSVSGQRTKQIMDQDKEMFPLEVEARKASTDHMKKITDEEGKIQVPGFGSMTPSQFSAHTARMERMDVLKKKSEPLLQFENQLQGAYGLGIKDIADASQPKDFRGEDGKTYKGTPFYDVMGQMVDKKHAADKPDQTFVRVGPNQVPIPIFNKKTGLGWQQISGKAKTLAPQMDSIAKDQADISQKNAMQQAQQIMAVNKSKDPSTLSPQDQQAIEWAKNVLGQ